MSKQSSEQVRSIVEWFTTRLSEVGLRRRRPADYIFAAAAILLFVVLTTTSDSFLTQGNLTNLAGQIVTNGLVSLGMLIVIVTGGIDLSVGSIVAISGIMAVGFSNQMPLPLAIVAALGVGALAGAFNGFFISRFKLPPFIVTLATLSTFRGLVYVYSETPKTATDPTFRSILGGASLGPIPVPFIIMIACFALVWVFLNRTVAGRTIYATGGNEEAVRLAGINVRRYILLAYVLSGLFSAVAGILLASRLGIAQPNVGVAYELDAIAACVIGGAVLLGGGGSVIGVFGGVLLLGLIDNLLNLFGVPSFFQQVFAGLIILVAVLARQARKPEET